MSVHLAGPKRCRSQARRLDRPLTGSSQGTGGDGIRPTSADRLRAIGSSLTGRSPRGINDDGDLILYASEQKPCSNRQFKREDWKEYQYRNIMTKKFNHEPS